MRTSKLINRTVEEICGISYTLERKNIKRLHLYVKPPDGKVLVTAPFSFTQSEIDEFIVSKLSWIKKHKEKYSDRPDQARMALQYVNGETLYFWGKPYELNVIERENVSRSKVDIVPEPEFVTDQNWLELFSRCSFDELVRYAEETGRQSLVKCLPEDNLPYGYASLKVPEGSTSEQREKVIRAAYKHIFDREAERVLDFWSSKTGLSYSSWHSRFMKSRWGSLTVKDHRVSLNTRLTEKPEICLIYVALHEIAHVKEANHGPKFKAILQRFMPSWRDAEKILKY